jgi:hypothetical protein
MREGDDLRVTCDVAISDSAVDPFRYNVSVQGDYCAKGILAFAYGDPRQFDAPRHHRFIRRIA